MSNNHSWLGFILLIAFCGSLNARNLNETAYHILKQSPEFKAQTYALESSFSTLRTSSNLPDPEVGGEYLIAPVSEDNRWAAELSWSVEWPGVYGARGKEAGSKMTAAERNVFAGRVEKLAEIKNLLLDYVQCRKKIELLDELNHNNDTIYQLAEKSAKGGELTVLDLNKVKLEYANIRGSKAALLDEEAAIIGELSQIYGGDCSELLGAMECEFPVIITPSDSEIARIKESAPAVQIANAEAEAARKAHSVAKMEALPSLSIGYKHAYEEETHFNGVLLGVSIPIFSSRGKQKAAKADIMEAELRAEAAAQVVEAEVQAILRRLTLMKQQIEEIEPIVENADYNATLLKAYKGGVITLIEYLADRNYFTTAAIDLVGLRHSAAKAGIELQKYLITESF